MTNKELIERYPFLRPRNCFTDEIIEDADYTELDDMPEGWRKAFGERMCEEIREELIKHNYLDEYRIIQIKEKYGMLCWYDAGSPADSNVYDIISKYEDVSRKICILCGKPATKISRGWICPYCDCVDTNKLLEGAIFTPIKEYFKEIDER